MLAGEPVLERTLDAVRASGLPWHLEDAGHEGMGDSIAAGVRATADASGWLILPGDLPLIQPKTLRAVAAALSYYGVVIPHYRGQRGHPVGFAASCRDALLMLTGAQGAASVLRAQEEINAAGRLDEDDDPGIVTDIDTVQDLRNAEALLVARQTR